MKRHVIVLLAACAVLWTPTSGRAAKLAGRDVEVSAALGLGAGFPVSPDQFDAEFKPSLGAVVEAAAAVSFVEVSVSADYNFFVRDAVEPLDANTLALFANLKIKPTSHGGVRPYVLVGGGLFRYWIVDAGVYDNSLGFAGGVGLQVDIKKTQRLFIEAKGISGRTRETNREKANTSYVVGRAGLVFVF